MRFLLGVLVGFCLANASMVVALAKATQVRVEFPPGTEQKIKQMLPKPLKEVVPKPIKTTKVVQEPTGAEMASLGL